MGTQAMVKPIPPSEFALPSSYENASVLYIDKPRINSMNDTIKRSALHHIQLLYRGLKDSPPPNPQYWQLRLYWLVGQFLVGESQLKGITLAQKEYLLFDILPARQWAEKLRYCDQFYTAFPDWELIHPALTWTHYLCLVSLRDPTMRYFYLQEAVLNHWSVRQLQRQIKSHHFQHILAPEELPYMQGQSTAVLPTTQSVLKERYILDFLNESEQTITSEKALEDALLNHLQAFLLELGRGFAFVARQQRITTDTGKSFYIDLSFYHYLLGRFVLFELKTTPLSHRDIGQLDYYVRLYDAKYKQPHHQPTIGVLLCPEQDSTWQRYSLLAEKDQLFVATYDCQLPARPSAGAMIDWEWLDQVLKQLHEDMMEKSPLST